MTGGHPSREDYINQPAAELAFAESMGWDDWTHGEEFDGCRSGTEADRVPAGGSVSSAASV